MTYKDMLIWIIQNLLNESQLDVTIPEVGRPLRHFFNPKKGLQMHYILRSNRITTSVVEGPMSYSAALQKVTAAAAELGPGVDYFIVKAIDQFTAERTVVRKSL